MFFTNDTILSQKNHTAEAPPNTVHIANNASIYTPVTPRTAAIV